MTTDDVTEILRSPARPGELAREADVVGAMASILTPPLRTKGSRHMPSLSRSTKILAAGLTGALMFGGVAAAVGGSRPFTSRSEAVATADDDTVTDPSVEEPTTDEPTVDEPVVDEPVVDEPTGDEPTSEEPTGDEPAAEEPAEGEDEEAPPAEDVECPADVKNHGQFVSRVARAHRDDETMDVRAAAHSDCGKKVAEPVAEEPVTEEPVTEEPVAEEPADDDAVEEPEAAEVTKTAKAPKDKAPKDNGSGGGNGQGNGNGNGNDNGGGNGGGNGKGKGGKG